MNFLKEIFIPGFKKSGRTAGWLLKIILPVSLAVRLMNYYGILAYIADFLNPVFIHLGLPGSTAIVFITSIFLPLYAPLAIIISMPVSLRELTILALMCQTSHNLPVESAIQAKTGTPFWAMVALRISMSIIIGLVLNLILPQNMGMPLFSQTHIESIGSLGDLFAAWLTNGIRMALLIFFIVAALNILYRLLEKYNLIDKLSKTVEPVLKIFGLPGNVAFLWLIGYIVGLAYGGALMMDHLDEGKISRSDVHLLNYHLAVSHSILEDNLLFVALGVSVWWILGTRLIAAAIVVWTKKLTIKFARNRKATMMTVADS
ncbi:MAG: nucleoside recognition protein [Dysgonamonadaceae bacterium]|jgi:hypothetical protein|nr:nucleoside recognition protein [Dysgonamonadaceae bacterium]